MVLPPTNNSNMTSKLCYYLDQESEEMLRGFTPEKMALVFGEQEVICFNPDKGYTDPDWYFDSPCGGVVGIGFRWGVARLRGKNLDQTAANEFVKFTHSLVNIALSAGR